MKKKIFLSTIVTFIVLFIFWYRFEIQFYSVKGNIVIEKLNQISLNQLEKGNLCISYHCLTSRNTYQFVNNDLKLKIRLNKKNKICSITQRYELNKKPLKTLFYVKKVHKESSRAVQRFDIKEIIGKIQITTDGSNKIFIQSKYGRNIRVIGSTCFEKTLAAIFAEKDLVLTQKVFMSPKLRFDINMVLGSYKLSYITGYKSHKLWNQALSEYMNPYLSD